MKNYVNIGSHIQLRGAGFNSVFTDEEIKNEPMFFNCSLDFAYDHSGPITQAFMDSLPEDWTTDAVIDTRSHMLMKGWYPCIPGWHHDDVPRSTLNGQPNYVNPEYRSEHLMGLVNAEVAPTEFALGFIELDIPENNIYRVWHPQVEQAVREHNLSLYKATSGFLYQFDDRTFHQGVKAAKNGWRWFARLSRKTDRVKNVTNEIRNQVQVYLEYPMEGW
jgi:hypothetical protein